ncbi:GNAT family N-acetyltransferase [Georgenia sp. SYP-B2076]|uniref:GNAT family N-acetyltransferase n=1 Tax=Georgenia sp. SYP-B2076 TaxID=2495881 RepID=UPI000F8C4D32|nr:GNAT family N-acetyltransferase [Georgenia sp. SYP-B2076]
MSTPAPRPDGAAPSGARGPLAERAQVPLTVPVPDGVAGLRWRALGEEDRRGLTALVDRIEEADNPPYRTSAEEVLEYFDTSHAWSAMGAWDADGVLRAFGFVRIPHGDVTLLRAFCSGGVDPGWRRHGAGSALMDWQVARARTMLVETGKEAPARIVVHVDDGMDTLEALLTARGFSPRRWYMEMRRDLSVPIPQVSLDGQLSIVPWSPDLDDAVRRAHNKAFGEEWGSQPHTIESWQQGRTHFAPSWSFVALDRSSDRARVAGYLISGRYAQDWPALGWSEGYTEMMGVLREWRGRHLATALLTEAMRAYAADGMQYAGLDVDTDNPTGAVPLYAHLGYERTRGSAMYTIEI